MALVKVPTVYEPAFRADFYGASRQYANWEVTAINPFFTDPGTVRACIDNTRRNPLRDDITSTESLTLPDWFVPPPDQAPLFGAYDLSVARDACAAAFVSVSGLTPVPMPDGSLRVGPTIRVELLARVVPQPGAGIRIRIMRQLVYDLYERGFPILLISFDGFQSIDSIQELTDRGFYAAVMSVDRTTTYPVIGSKLLEGGARVGTLASMSTNGRYSAPMDTLREAIMEGRVSVPPYQEVDGVTQFEREAMGLEWHEKDRTVRKSEHVPDDLIQVVAAAVFHAVNYTHIDSVMVGDYTPSSGGFRDGLGSEITAGGSGGESDYQRGNFGY